MNVIQEEKLVDQARPKLPHRSFGQARRDAGAVPHRERRPFPAVEKLWSLGRSRSFSTSVAILAALSTPATAWADPGPEPNAEPSTVVRRGGLSFGVALGPLVGGASGYPNDVLKIGRKEFLTETGFAGGGAGSLWVAMTFNDYLAFGLAGYGGAAVGASHLATFNGFAFRVEAYPAFGVGGAFRDLGFSLESGLGGLSATVTDGDGTKVIDAGLASRFAVGAFYDGVRAWKLSMGPFVAADLMWSNSSSRPAVWLGWRTAFANRP